MDPENILSEVIRLAAVQFQVDAQVLGPGSTASDVASWNSLSHVMLVASIEKAFDVKFDLLQMIDMKSLEDIARATHLALQ
jgi:acyl carrier protein